MRRGGPGAFRIRSGPGISVPVPAKFPDGGHVVRRTLGSARALLARSRASVPFSRDFDGRAPYRAYQLSPRASRRPPRDARLLRRCQSPTLSSLPVTSFRLVSLAARSSRFVPVVSFAIFFGLCVTVRAFFQLSNVLVDTRNFENGAGEFFALVAYVTCLTG